MQNINEAMKSVGEFARNKERCFSESKVPSDRSDLTPAAVVCSSSLGSSAGGTAVIAVNPVAGNFWSLFVVW